MQLMRGHRLYDQRILNDMIDTAQKEIAYKEQQMSAGQISSEIDAAIARMRELAEAGQTLADVKKTPEVPPEQPRRFGHHFRTCKYQLLDAYRICDLFNVTNPGVQRAIARLLHAQRGDFSNELVKAMEDLSRALEMKAEDSR